MQQTLEEISKNIKSKRRVDLDTQYFPRKKAELNPYDIRIGRDGNTTLNSDLKRSGQLQPLTLNIKTKINIGNTSEFHLADAFIIVNGRTRKIEMDILNEKYGLFHDVSVEIYVNLTELEEDYLNAQINSTQTPLNADEKIAFVKRYKNTLEPKALGKALGIAEAMLENYLEVAEAPEDVLVEYRQEHDGFGRSSLKVEEFAKISKAVKNVNVDPKEKPELMKALGRFSANNNSRRDVKRKMLPILAKKSAELSKDIRITNKYNYDEVVAIASSEIAISSGDKLPLNSKEKYNIIDNLLKDTYDFAIILCAEGLTRIDNDGNEVDSETKRVIDKIDDVILVGAEMQKLLDATEYAEKLGKKCEYHKMDAIDSCGILNKDSRKGFVYVNGAMLYTQRPQFMNYLKSKYNNSTVVMLIIDLLYGKSNVCQTDRDREKITVYAGAETFDDMIAHFDSVVANTKFIKYADTPQQKYVAYAK